RAGVVLPEGSSPRPWSAGTCSTRSASVGRTPAEGDRDGTRRRSYCRQSLTPGSADESSRHPLLASQQARTASGRRRGRRTATTPAVLALTARFFAAQDERCAPRGGRREVTALPPLSSKALGGRASSGPQRIRTGCPGIT